MADIHILGSGKRRSNDLITRIEDVERINNQSAKEIIGKEDKRVQSAGKTLVSEKYYISMYDLCQEDFFYVVDSSTFISNKIISETMNKNFETTKDILSQKCLFLPTVKNFTDYIIKLREVYDSAESIMKGEYAHYLEGNVLEALVSFGIVNSENDLLAIDTFLDMQITPFDKNRIAYQVKDLRRFKTNVLTNDKLVLYHFDENGFPILYAKNQEKPSYGELQYLAPIPNPHVGDGGEVVYVTKFSRGKGQPPILSFRAYPEGISVSGSLACIRKETFEALEKRYG